MYTVVSQGAGRSLWLLGQTGAVFSIAEFDLSDHLPVCCTLRFEIEPHSNNESGENINLNTWVHYKWNPNQQASFLHQF